MLARKLSHTIFFATLWQTPHWIVLKMKYNKSHKSSHDGFRFEKQTGSHEYKFLHEAATRKRITKNTNDETDPL